jgi:hypothetical protein
LEHLEIASSELWLFEPFPTDLYTWQYGVTKTIAELGLTDEVQQEHQILNGTASLKQLSYAKHANPRMETWEEAEKKLKRKIRTAFQERFNWIPESSKFPIRILASR